MKRLFYSQKLVLNVRIKNFLYIKDYNHIIYLKIYNQYFFSSGNKRSNFYDTLRFNNEKVIVIPKNTNSQRKYYWCARKAVNFYIFLILR